MKYCVLRNDDGSLTVYFSNEWCVDCTDNDIDDAVFSYMPGVTKTQVFDIEQFQDATCH